ncbi:hypothetical protein V2J09_007897 [Rumex salicifolius]
MKFSQIAVDNGRLIPRLGLLIFVLFILPSPAASQSPPSPGTDSNNIAGDFSPSMGVIVIILIAALFFMGFFSIYIRHCSEDESSVSNARRISAVRSRRAPRGLDASVIESFPTFDYSAVKTLKIGKGALECAVCLNEFEDDETLRLIPKCDHVFHPECIDAWLAAHTTCPVCRANLVPGASVHAQELGHISEAHHAHEEGGEVEIIGADNQNDDVVIDVVGQPVGPTGPVHCGDAESMEQPLNYSLPPRLNRNRTRHNISGRPKWLGKFSRSNSTGHVAVKQWENMDRFTLRLPEEVRRQIMSGKLSRTTSCVGLPTEGSSRRGNRPVWAGEGSNRGSLFGSGRLDRTGRSDRWVFSLTPPFFSRAPSLKSPKVMASVGGSVCSTKAADSVNGVDEPRLPPIYFSAFDYSAVKTLKIEKAAVECAVCLNKRRM